MKKILSILVLGLLLSGNGYAIASFKNDSTPLNQRMERR